MPREKQVKEQKEDILEVDSLPKEIQTGAVYFIRQANPNSYTHGMFKYPCKFIPEIPRWAMLSYLEGGRTTLVFDPFAGSGTTLLEANLHGFDAAGTEIDDIAKLIIRVKTSRLTGKQMEQMDLEYGRIMEYMETKRARGFRPQIENLSHWFPAKTITKLGRMKVCIDGIEDPQVRDFFRLCMVSMIKRVSYADDTSPKPYVSNKIKKIPPTVEKEFSSVYRRYRQMEEQLAQVDTFGKSEILAGDALEFCLDTGADLAVTSPPYINAFDYGRTMRLENLWLGTLTEDALRKKKKDYVGTEKIDASREKECLDILGRSALLKAYYEKIEKTDLKRALVVKRFFEDMEKNLKRVYEHLKPGGRYIIVIGNSTIRKVTVESWRVLSELAEKTGYQTEQYFSYVIRNPYLRIPRGGMGGKINRDYVLVLGKETGYGAEKPNKTGLVDSKTGESAPDDLSD